MAKSRSHKRQHWVPRSYLAAWSDPETPPAYEPYVNVFNKDGTNHKRRAPDKLFTETDLYTIQYPDGTRDLRLEDGLSGLEGDFVRIRKNYLERRKQLALNVHLKLLIFAAAMHARNPATRDHHAEHWGRVLGLMDELDERMRNATPEQRKAAAFRIGEGSGPKLRHDQVRGIVDQPMRHMLGPLIRGVFEPMARMMHCLVLCTDTVPGFITSDNPMVWYDSEAYKRPPMYRSPAFMHKTLEITLPASPQQLLLFTRGTPGVSYFDCPETWVDELNRRTRAFSNGTFVVSRNIIKPFWLDTGSMPEDAWDKVHATSEADGES